MGYSRKFICNELPSAQELREWRREEMLKKMLRDLEEIDSLDDQECEEFDRIHADLKARNILK